MAPVSGDLVAKIQTILEGMPAEDQEQALFLVEQLGHAPHSRVGFMAHLLGLHWEFVGRGHVRCEMPVTPILFNPQGVLLGGAIFTLVDYAMGAATASLLDFSRGERLTTVEMKINYLSPVKGGKLVAEAKVVSEGSRIVVLEAHVTCEDGTLSALSTGTFYIIRPRPK